MKHSDNDEAAILLVVGIIVAAVMLVAIRMGWL